jgi:hypothetical protein
VDILGVSKPILLPYALLISIVASTDIYKGQGSFGRRIGGLLGKKLIKHIQFLLFTDILSFVGGRESI